MKRNETQLVKACIEYLTLTGCFVWRQNQGAMQAGKRFIRFSHCKGISDIIGMTPGGQFLAVECKMGRNKPSEDQQRFLDSVQEHGGLAIVAYSVEDVEQAILTHHPPETHHEPRNNEHDDGAGEGGDEGGVGY